MAERPTPEQQKIIDDRGGTLLVSAAAGSGKTKVLIDRLMARIMDEGRSINEFLIITFTRAAASELREKIAKKISEHLARDPANSHLQRQLHLVELAQISTVHAFCSSVIREYGYLQRISADFAMAEDAEIDEILTRLIDDLLEQQYAAPTPGFLALTDLLGHGRTDADLAGQLKRMLSAMESEPHPAQFLRDLRPQPLDPDHAPLTEWEKVILQDACLTIDSWTARLDWALQMMPGMGCYNDKYIGEYEDLREFLQRLRDSLEAGCSWDAVPGMTAREYPRITKSRGECDEDMHDRIKKVRDDIKKGLAELGTRFGRPRRELLEEHNAAIPALCCLLDLTETLWTRFRKEKRRRNLMTFSDLEQDTIALLTNPDGTPTSAAEEISARYCEIMVDEYQDSNRVQEVIYAAVAGEQDRNRFLVGDVKQSIYGFRRAEPGIFLQKYGAYAPGDEAGEGEPRVRVLSNNFRSRPEILEAANHVFRAVMSPKVGGIDYDERQQLNPGLGDAYPDDGQKAHVFLHVLEMEKDDSAEEEAAAASEVEAVWVVNRVLKMLEDGVPVRDGDQVRPAQPGDIAILLRTNTTAAVYRRALKNAGLPYSSDRAESVYDTPEVTALINLLKVIDNPHQDIPMLGVLCGPLFRLSNDNLAELKTGGSQRRIYDTLLFSEADWAKAAAARLKALRTRAGLVPADQLVWSILYEEGLLRACAAMPNGAARRKNLLAVYDASRRAGGTEYLQVYQLLQKIERWKKQSAGSGNAAGGGVILTTMHGSKGLEYPIVVLPELSHEFNLQDRSQMLLISSELGLAPKLTDRESRVVYSGIAHQAAAIRCVDSLRSEELRILYVAMTRAKDYLVMTGRVSSRNRSRIGSMALGAGYPRAMEWAARSGKSFLDYLVLAAATRMESGALAELLPETGLSRRAAEFPWGITMEKVGELELERYAAGAAKAEAGKGRDILSPAQLIARLTWQYPHEAATLVPSKMTPTKLKGKQKETEAVSDTTETQVLAPMAKPDFIRRSRGLTPTEKGTAAHLFLQYADYGVCDEEAGIQGELDRLTQEEFLTEQQAEAVSVPDIRRLFTSELGQRLRAGERVVREYKFSVLRDAGSYDPAAKGEQVLLQGVIDAAILDKDGITIIDFKTDRVTEATLPERAAHYRDQLDTYEQAAEMIFHLPVRQKILYFLRVGKAVEV